MERAGSKEKPARGSHEEGATFFSRTCGAGFVRREAKWTSTRGAVCTLHVVCGPPAGGKTVYGKQLAANLMAAFFDSDTACEPVVQAGLAAAGLSPDDRDSPRYKEIYREPVYEVLFRLAEDNLPHLPVVLAAPFTRESQDVTWPERLQQRFGVPVEIHFVYCDPALRRERIVARGETRDLAKLAQWERYLATTAEEAPPFPHVWVDTGRLDP